MVAAELLTRSWRQVVASIGFHAEAELLYKASGFALTACDRGAARDEVGVDGALPPEGRVQAASVFAALGRGFRGIA